jgi:hypothetical protein
MTALLQSTRDLLLPGARLWAAAGAWARDGAWLTADRTRAYAKLLGALFVVSALAFVAASHDGVDVNGKPLGTDFNSFWTASKLALTEPATAVYDTARHRSAQVWGDLRDDTYAAFFYPPVFLLICLPLALVPYGVSLWAWLGVTGAAYAYVLRRMIGGSFGLLPRAGVSGGLAQHRAWPKCISERCFIGWWCFFAQRPAGSGRRLFWRAGL